MHLLRICIWFGDTKYLYRSQPCSYASQQCLRVLLTCCRARMSAVGVVGRSTRTYCDVIANNIVLPCGSNMCLPRTVVAFCVELSSRFFLFKNKSFAVHLNSYLCHYKRYMYLKLHIPATSTSSCAIYVNGLPYMMFANFGIFWPPLSEFYILFFCKIGLFSDPPSPPQCGRHICKPP